VSNFSSKNVWKECSGAVRGECLDVHGGLRLAVIWATDVKTHKQTDSSGPVMLCGWLRSTVVERRYFTSELSLSCAWPAADRWPLMWVNRLLQVNQLGQLDLSSFQGR